MWLHYTHANFSFIEKQWPNPANGTVSGYMEWQWMALRLRPFHALLNCTTLESKIYPADIYPWDARHTSVLFFLFLLFLLHRTFVPQLPIIHGRENAPNTDFDQIPKCNEAIIDTNDARKISREAGRNLNEKKKRPLSRRQSTSEFHLAHIIYWLENICNFFSIFFVWDLLFGIVGNWCHRRSQFFNSP